MSRHKVKSGIPYPVWLRNLSAGIVDSRSTVWHLLPPGQSQNRKDRRAWAAQERKCKGGDV